VTAIRLAIAPLPAIALVIGMLCTWRFPITKAKHAEILRQLMERRMKPAACKNS
jgi:GPH family glycoside/pentoside/hexuronide:cation symporter